jgi:predicted deacylase
MPRSGPAALSLAILLAVAGGAASPAGADERRRVEATLPASPQPARPAPAAQVIGRSVEGRPIEAFTFGEGDTHLLLVGGMHGGYEWNSVLLAWTVKDWLAGNPGEIPPGLKVTVIPSLNPDGVFAVVGKEGRFTALEAIAGAARKSLLQPAAAAAAQGAAAGPDGVPWTGSARGRFNARGVDLNRNFGCAWQREAGWSGRAVSAGPAPFSEPESAALRDFVRQHRPDAAVFWHSQAGAVFAAQCGAGLMLETLALMQTYAEAAGYRRARAFGSYETTGDAESWLATLRIPAITVELLTRDSIEWPRNLAALKALFAFYDRKAKRPAS